MLALFVPLALVFIVDGKRGLREVWPAALVCGVAFALAQFVTSNYFSVPLTDIVAALVSAGAVVLFLRVWQPAEAYVEDEPADEPVAAGRRGGPGRGTAEADRLDRDRTTVSGSGSGLAADDEPADEAGTGTGRHREPVGRGRVVPPAGPAPAQPDPPAEVFRAYAPYLIIIVVFSIAQIPASRALVAETSPVIFNWPGLDSADAAGKPPALHELQASTGWPPPGRCCSSPACSPSRCCGSRRPRRPPRT